MPTFVPAKVSTQYIFFASLVSQANTKIMQVNPTIAAGDFKISIDGGALANLGTLPAVTPAGSSMVKFTLSTTEMAGANATVVCIDAAGSEWCDLTINIQTAARQIDDLAFPTVSGRSLDVTTTGEAGIDWANVGAPTTALALTGTTIATTQKVDIETIKTNPVVNAGTVTFPTTATLASTTNLTAGTITTVSGNVNGSVGSVTGAVGSVTGAVGSVTGAVGSVTGAVGSVTGNVGGNVVGTVASVVGAVGSVTGAVGSVTGNIGGNVVGSVATVTDITTTAQAELSAPPASNAAPLAKLNWLFILAKNKLTQTSTTQLVKANDGSTTVGTSTVSDDGTTATRGVFS